MGGALRGSKARPSPPRLRECLAFPSDEAVFSSCAMLPAGEGMAVAVRR